MITYLSVQNFATIENLALDLPTGFIAITGETGAGKSVFLNAIQLILGARSDQGVCEVGVNPCGVWRFKL